MIYLLALIPATALTIAGYFALFLSTRMEGGLRTFGKYLGVWAFTLAALVVLGALFAAAHGGRHRMMRMHAMHGRMHGPWPGRPGFGPPPERGAPPPENAPPPPTPSNAPTPESPGASPQAGH
jgi:hypothetical protein